MDGLWRQMKDNGGVCGAEDGPERDLSMVPIRNDYRWTPACQRAFLEELACVGSVTRAAAHVGKSVRSAYSLRFRHDGAAFRLGWDAAVLIARAVLADMLMDRAICGYEEMVVRQDDGVIVRGRFDNRLSMGVLCRLDRIAGAQEARGSMAAQVQMVAQDFGRFLDVIENGGTMEAAERFLLEQEASAIECELAQNSAAVAAASAATGDLRDMPEEAALAKLSVWYCEDSYEWKTNFPPGSADDAACVEEYGRFGDKYYQRTLTFAEEEAHFAALDARTANLRAAAHLAREQWLGVESSVSV
jgi:hypothetical protein